MILNMISWVCGGVGGEVGGVGVGVGVGGRVSVRSDTCAFVLLQSPYVFM